MEARSRAEPSPASPRVPARAPAAVATARHYRTRVARAQDAPTPPLVGVQSLSPPGAADVDPKEPSDMPMSLAPAGLAGPLAAVERVTAGAAPPAKAD